jgi:hypothetical protein
VKAVKNYQISRKIIPTGFLGSYTRAVLLDEKLIPITLNNFKPNNPITRAEASKLAVMLTAS